MYVSTYTYKYNWGNSNKHSNSCYNIVINIIILTTTTIELLGAHCSVQFSPALSLSISLFYVTDSKMGKLLCRNILREV